MLLFDENIFVSFYESSNFQVSLGHMYKATFVETNRNCVVQLNILGCPKVEQDRIGKASVHSSSRNHGPTASSAISCQHVHIVP